MMVGSVVFGPRGDVTTNAAYPVGGVIGVSGSATAQACCCVGPQPGEKLCPCALRREAEKGRQMIADGVTINGRRYRLVPDDQP